MTLQAKIEQAFADRPRPAQVVDRRVTQFDSDVDEALWFQGRDRRELTRRDWQQHSSAIFFFSPEGFAYYLPSLLRVSMEKPSEWLYATDVLLSFLDLSPSIEGWPDHVAERLFALRSKELEAMQEWLVAMCDDPNYRGYGLSGSGPGDKFGRALQAVDLLQRRIERTQMESRAGVSGSPAQTE
jgi:uncharacterized protein DUF6714